ncbi:ubiquitin domain-containing protein [Cavenderia fasciculata]|uniref:Ubiquitin domain-containing protein n=1 Tax=Cavenderia fasciculata TaxID=261658 RepID=F4PR21_CACFS|nr:ubiquitin domain-containing protein [Cavenderia fasciculata]EGG22078.1 ubiquitin domain-containing protein [Cavenderia fasciculata]|eukprot:XP_004359929.1 ubiquitin domain-containing protein [Cavenderia fasciculata]
MDDSIVFDVLYDGNTLPMVLPINATISILKSTLEAYTGIPINKQMLLNLVNVNEDTTLASMDLSRVEMVQVDESSNNTEAATTTTTTVVAEQNNTTPNNNNVVSPSSNINAININESNNSNSSPSIATPPVNNSSNNNDDENNNIETFSDDDDDAMDGGDYDVSRPYVTSRFATNYFPNSSFDQDSNLSPQALTEFLDQVSYPTFASDYASFGMNLPEPFQGSYKEALNEAKLQGKLVLTYLHSPESEQCVMFCSILEQEKVFEFIMNNYIFYVGTINETAQMLLFNLIPFESYPIVALVANFSSTPRVLELLQGITDGDEFYSKIIHQYTSNMQELDRIKAEEEQKQEERRLVQDQDEAYEESLKADIEKAKKEQQERQRIEQEEQKINDAKQLRLDRINLVPPEPAKGPKSTQIIFKLPDDSKLERRFNSTDTLQTLSDFLHGSGIEIENFQFVTQFPKKVYTGQDFKQTLEESQIHPQSILNVRSNDE